jgi:hypothetical protein
MNGFKTDRIAFNSYFFYFSGDNMSDEFEPNIIAFCCDY